jgi:hypothetical protein
MSTFTLPNKIIRLGRFIPHSLTSNTLSRSAVLWAAAR